MVGVAAQYLLMPLMTTYLGWSDTIILIVRLVYDPTLLLTASNTKVQEFDQFFMFSATF